MAAGTLGAITFNFFGSGKPSGLEARLFAVWFVCGFILIQLHSALIGTRRDYLRGRWSAEGLTAQAGAIINPWWQIGPFNLLIAILLALTAGYVVIPSFADLDAKAFSDYIGDSNDVFRIRNASLRYTHISAIKAILVVASMTILATSLLLYRLLPQDQATIASFVIDHSDLTEPPFYRYLLIEHVLPWAGIQALINAGIGSKQFVFEAAKLADLQPPAVAAKLVGADFGAVLAIIAFFLFIASEGQVRTDLRLGRLPARSFAVTWFKTLGIPAFAALLLLAAILLAAVAAPLAQGLLALVGPKTFSPPVAAAIKGLAAVAGVAIGCPAGIWWGVRRETALIEREGSEAYNPPDEVKP